MKATSFPLAQITDREIDLNDVAGANGFLFVREGIGFAGIGISARAHATEARELLSAIENSSTDAPIGVGPIMFGSIPFDTTHDADFIMPTVTFCKTREGETWVTVIDDSPIPEINENSATSNTAHFDVRDGVALSTYIAAVEAARNAVRSGDLTKAVIARDVFVQSDAPIDIHQLLLRLRTSFGTSYRYSFDGFVGASPELLVAFMTMKSPAIPLQARHRALVMHNRMLCWQSNYWKVQKTRLNIEWSSTWSMTHCCHIVHTSIGKPNLRSFRSQTFNTLARSL